MNNLGLLMIYVLAFIAIFYFLAIRPQQRQRRAHEALVSSLKKGDRIVSAGGIYGTVKRVEDNVLLIEVAKGVEIRLARKAVSEVVEGAEAGKSTGSRKTIEPPVDEVAEVEVVDETREEPYADDERTR